MLFSVVACSDDSSSADKNATTTGGAGGQTTSSSSVGGGSGGLSTGGNTAAGNTAGGATTVIGPFVSTGNYPFPRDPVASECARPAAASADSVKAAYDAWKTATLSADGAGGFLRVRKPDSGTVIGSTVSEGMGYGMLLAVYFGEQPIFDALWKYTAQYLNAHGLMDWEVDPTGKVIGQGAATDGDEDIAFALLMAARQWGGQGSLSTPYLELAKTMMNAILAFEVDTTRQSMLAPGDAWGGVDVTNISYFAPAYFRVFAEVTGKQTEWNAVIDENYAILARSLNAQSGNADNGLVPAWCNSSGVPVVAYSGAPTHFQNDSTRTPFRVGQDYCWFGDTRAKEYLDKIASFYSAIGVANIVDGYQLDGTPKPEKAVGGLQAASFVGPAGVAFSASASHQTELDQAWSAVASQKLTAGTTYYQKSWSALSLLMMGGYFSVFPEVVTP
jgi:endo-1,4-beta-D-glucanase Y